MVPCDSSDHWSRTRRSEILLCLPIDQLLSRVICRDVGVDKRSISTEYVCARWVPSDHRTALFRLLCQCFLQNRANDDSLSNVLLWIKALFPHFLCVNEMLCAPCPRSSEFKQAVASRLSIRAAGNRINRLKAFAPFYTTSIPDMSVHKIQILSVTLAVLWSAVGVSCSYDPRSCTNPAVRKEWRAFGTKEKAEWIRAVNVRIDSTPASVVLLKEYTYYFSACQSCLMTRPWRHPWIPQFPSFPRSTHQAHIMMV
jgi:hypothetical protein